MSEKPPDIFKLMCECAKVEKMTLSNKAWGEDCLCTDNSPTKRKRISLIVVTE